MTLSVSELNAHYTEPGEMIRFFLVAFLCMLVSVLILTAAAKSKAGKVLRRRYGHKVRKEDLQYEARDRAEWLTQAFYEMMFTDACILGFIGVYVILDWFVTVPAVRTFWDQYSDFILLGLIVLSCVLNSFLDRVFVRLRDVSREEKASIRLIGMLYMGILFLYIKFIYEDNNYDRIMVYYLGLMVGRFVYFDASFQDFRNSVRGAFRNLPVMLLALVDTAVMAAYGFQEGYLLKINGVVVSLLIAHLYMILGIFLIAHTHLVERLTPINE